MTTTFRRKIGASQASMAAPSSRISSSARYCRFIRTSAYTMSGMTTTMTQPPSVNSAMANTTTITAHTTAAVALTATLFRQCSPRWVRWCFTIPAPAMVNPVKTPMAYMGINADTLAPVASSSTTEAAASTMIPLENTRRCPRTVSLRGRNESSATKLTRKGKPVKLVFAARIRIRAVAACSM